jgi:hypothetical protein
VDPEDDSVTGTIKYLVYRKRKQNEFFKEIAKIQFSSNEKLDPSEVIKKMTNDYFPLDIKEQIIADLMNKKQVEDEAKKTFKVKVGKDGSIKLKVK